MWKQIDQRIQRAMNGVRRAFRGKGATVKNGGAVQLVSGEALAGEPMLDAELFQHYGYTSMPPNGFMYVAVPVGGVSSHSIIIATEHGQFRLKTLKAGEVALYDDQGQSVILKRGKIMEMNTDKLVINAKDSIQLNTLQVLTTGLIKADKDITDLAGSGGQSMANMRQVYDGHDHKENNVSGGNTNKPNQQI